MGIESAKLIAIDAAAMAVELTPTVLAFYTYGRTQGKKDLKSAAKVGAVFGISYLGARYVSAKMRGHTGSDAALDIAVSASIPVSGLGAVASGGARTLSIARYPAGRGFYWRDTGMIEYMTRRERKLQVMQLPAGLSTSRIGSDKQLYRHAPIRFGTRTGNIYLVYVYKNQVKYLDSTRGWRYMRTMMLVDQSGRPVTTRRLGLQLKQVTRYASAYR